MVIESVETMKDRIIIALRKNLVKQSEISGQACHATRKLLKGEKLNDSTVMKLYERLEKKLSASGLSASELDKEMGDNLQVLDKAIDKLSKPVDKAIDKLSKPVDKAEDKLSKPVDKAEVETLRVIVEGHEQAITLLQIENKRLKDEIENLKVAKVVAEAFQDVGNQRAERVLGFSLTQRKTGANVAYWYAGKQIAGKQLWIYLGRDKSGAEAKIKAYLTGKGIEA